MTRGNIDRLKILVSRCPVRKLMVRVSHQRKGSGKGLGSTKEHGQHPPLHLPSEAAGSVATRVKIEASPVVNRSVVSQFSLLFIRQV